MLPFLSLFCKSICGAMVLLSTLGSVSAQTTFAPNGNSGFGGNLGQGNGLTISNDGQGGIKFLSI